MPAVDTAAMLLPLASAEATLDRVGGKGANLARLALAGYPVPPGFLITTPAYIEFVDHNQLAGRILGRLADLQPSDPAALESASASIRGWFAGGAIPPALAQAIRAAYAALGGPPVAVRSSATAEDLPDMSFAGQQDTYLNVTGGEDLLKAVVNCWSSLWTARAIGYRARNGIAAESVALAVVVQAMVPSEASGVLFTANPLTGLRSETVIDATLGLGEALVAGQVAPDHYVVHAAAGTIVSKTLGAKAIALRGAVGGGVERTTEQAAGRQALPDEQIIELARLGQRVAAEFDFPQDIEWAWAGGQLHLLQSRPITSLYPVPDGFDAERLHVWFSFGAVQGMLDPFTPLGADAIRLVMVSAARLAHYRTTYDRPGVIHAAGGRLWANMTPLIRNGLGRRVARVALRFVEPSVGRVIEQVWDDPRLGVERRLPSPGVIGHLLSLFVPLALKVMRFLIDPVGRRRQVIAQAERMCDDFAARYPPGAGLKRHLEALRELDVMFPRVMPTVGSGLIAGMASLNAVTRLAQHLPGAVAGRGPLARTLELTRGLPHNVTTEMDLALWQTARAIRAEPEAGRHVQTTPAHQLARAYLSGQLPAAAQRAVGDFLERYGFRGLAEIDLGRPRWREDPTPVLEALQSYLRIDDEAQAPDAVFGRGQRAAEAALEDLIRAARATPGGALKARVLRWLGGRLRATLGMRESPKFYVIRIMGVIRAGLLEDGRAFAASGLLDQPDDLVFLTLSELDQLAAGEGRDWRALVAERRAVYERETRRRQVPRLLLSDGRAFYEGLGGDSADAGVIVGSPVSAGVVEGAVRVVRDPHGAQLAPGEIMVCPGTDPSWTPLFLAAGGLVMEVGGMMTHGSVVAREYGIPAVVGVDRATERLITGQRIRVDGSTGRIEILDPAGTIEPA